MQDIMRDELGAPQIVDRRTFQAQLGALRVYEKAHTREADAIAAARRRLPLTGAIDRDVTSRQELFNASADYRLSLAAAPTFAIMALLTAVVGGGQPDILCAAADQMSPLSGMIPMYLLMSAFHSQPWLKLISSRRKRRSPGVIRPHTNLSPDHALIGR
jgi:Bacterial protein of unknown function (DUF899)